MSVMQSAGQPGQHEWAGPARGYAPCPAGRHWGPLGAAGILPYVITPRGACVLLGLRSRHVQAGGTWSTFGGAIEDGETAEQAAAAELGEEVSGLDAGALTVTGVLEAPCPAGCGWAYTTFIARIPAGDRLNASNRPEDYLPSVQVAADAANAWETDDVQWWPARALDVLADAGRLHPAFAAAWPALRAHVLDQEG